MDLSVDLLKQLLEALDEGGASELEYEDENVRLRIGMARGAPIVTAAPAAPVAAAAVAPAAAAGGAAPAEADDPDVSYITSPFVGTFYRAPSPGSEPFTKEGADAKPGQTLCIIEAMKLMNEIEAEYPCKVLEILVENGTSVEFGQKLFKVKQA